MAEAAVAVADAHRREWAAVLAATVRTTRDLDLAEECAQDAFVEALGAWARGGVPARPGAWLTVAARHNALDALRRAGTPSRAQVSSAWTYASCTASSAVSRSRVTRTVAAST